MSDTPMTDFRREYEYDLQFTSEYRSEVYHAVQYHAPWRALPLVRENRKDEKFHTICGLTEPTPWPLHAALTAWDEEDISPVRRPCKRCLAALRKAQEGEDETQEKA